MGKHIENQYAPDFVSPPGETLEETLEVIGMSQAELAERTSRPKKMINEIIQGTAAITPETALQLERVLGVPASFWNERERQYREFLAQQEETRQLEGQLKTATTAQKLLSGRLLRKSALRRELWWGGSSTKGYFLILTVRT